MEIEIGYRLAVAEDKPEILKLLQEHFFPYEPIACSVRPQGHDSHLENYMLSCVTTADRYCLLALTDNQIIGVRICSPKGPDDEQIMLKKASEIPGSQCEKVLRIFAAIDKNSKIFEKYNFNKSMHGNGLAVHKDFRGHGIGLQLYDKSIQIAKALGYQLFTTDCTSKYSARLCEILGMECINVFKMEDFRFPGSDEQVLFPAENQKYIKTYAKVLE